MKIIDAHIHLSHIESFKQTAKKRSFVDYRPSGYVKEMKENNVIGAIGMGLRELEGSEGFPDSRASSPMELDMLKKESLPIGLCPGINPYKLGAIELERLEQLILQDHVVGIKIYLGYYPFYAYDRCYQPVYKLAEDYHIPVVFHTGDTYSERGLLKYAHPLTIDEVAVAHPNVTFVLAHLGDPWMLDAAEVVYKNKRVYADLSGLIVGDQKEVQRISTTPHFFDHFKHALAFCDSYDKLLFGTDWPLVPIEPYVRFIKEHIPSKHWESVFHDNALTVFPKLKNLLK
ncbi:amidohydrolase family protein [Paenalkalicoccus suaedae]|uniref:Amidohydrolase family protein n=1 Tax=Paenalkalicoccus suaedae TaxID=2592382 RepID=A0A859FF47_9BACI|nr:amidohydrolase family protein [Paenalkalicoccus suaedae]QKS71322.1 amidohydrolase family protein [Paenalkalicoccus suaedae]